MSEAEQPQPEPLPAQLAEQLEQTEEPAAGPAEPPAGPAEPAAGQVQLPAAEPQPAGGQAEPASYEMELSAGQAATSQDEAGLVEEQEAGVVPPALVELSLSEVRPSVLLRPGQEAGLVVLAEVDEPFRSLHIYVGQAEAKAIQAGWYGGRPARPSTWDLLLQAVELLGGRVKKVVIDKVEEARHFFATVELEQAGETFSLSCRPSDAIALAVRTGGAGLYTTEDVLAAAGQYP